MFRNLPSRYAKARLLPTLMLRPSGFLYNTRNAESYTLNPVAACLVAALQRGVEPDALWNELVYRFEVDEPQAHCDTLQFLSTLHQLGLLTLPRNEEAEAEEEEKENEADPDEAGAHQAPDSQDGPDQPDRPVTPDHQAERGERAAPGGVRR